MDKDSLDNLKPPALGEEALSYDHRLGGEVPEELKATCEYFEGANELDSFYELPPDLPEETPAWAAELPGYQEMPLAATEDVIPEHLPSPPEWTNGTAHIPEMRVEELDDAIVAAEEIATPAPTWMEIAPELPPTIENGYQAAYKDTEVELPPAQAEELLKPELPPEEVLVLSEEIETASLLLRDEWTEPELTAQSVEVSAGLTSDTEMEMEYPPQTLVEETTTFDDQVDLDQGIIASSTETVNEQGLPSEPLYITAEEGLSLDEVIADIDSEMKHTTIPASMVGNEMDAATASLRQRYIVFSLANTRYAISIENVMEMGRVPRIATVPRAPKWIRGVTNMRGDILSVIEFRAFLGIAPLEQVDAARMLVVRSCRSELTTGLIVDDVKGLQELSADEIVSTSSAIEDRVTPFLRGLYGEGEELLVVLDLESFLASSEIRTLRS